MADRVNFPQIPSTLWWGLRQQLRRSPNATVDEKFLSINLNVQSTAARQYVGELKRTGLVSEDGKATQLAMKWRTDEGYREAADEIVASCYPQSLLDVAPPGDAERSKVMAWFISNGLGEGTAKNKAGTFLLLANEAIQEAPDGRGSTPEKKSGMSEKRSREPRASPQRETNSVKKTGSPPELPPLNVNVQIHISAEASGDQIEAIFSSMRKYLYNDLAA